MVTTRKKSQLDVLFDADEESDPAVNDLFAPIETSLLEEDDEKPKRRRCAWLVGRSAVGDVE